MLLLIYCLMYFPLFCGSSVFVFVLLCITKFVHSSFEIILKGKRKLVALLLLSYSCIVTINVLWLFLTVPWVSLQCVIVVFSDHTHLLYNFDMHLYAKFDQKIPCYSSVMSSFTN